MTGGLSGSTFLTFREGRVGGNLGREHRKSRKKKGLQGQLQQGEKKPTGSLG